MCSRWRNGPSDFTSFSRFGALVSLALGFAALPALAQSAGDHFRQDDFQGRPALVVSNDLLELTILNTSGAFARLLLTDDADKINPMWDHIRMARERNRPMWGLTYVGHFICVDGFGPPSDEEEKAGLPQHGEARDLAWTTESAVKKGKIAELVQAVHLPRVQEMLRRTIRLVDGENVVYVHSTLENLLTFDRPINWAEHGTIGSPFFEPGTVVDLSATRAMTRPDQMDRDNLGHRVPPSKEFTWPHAPKRGGGTIDLRLAPESSGTMDRYGFLIDPEREFGYVTALNPKRRLLLGYVFPRSDYPWLQIWEYLPPKGMMIRGLEFGSQAFDWPRRKVITMNKLFDTMLYRWLPARSTIEARYLMFWTRPPEGFQGVDDIQLRDGQLYIRDDRSGQTLALKASQGL